MRVKMEAASQDATDLLDSEYKLFNDPCIYELKRRWRAVRSNGSLHDFLFVPDTETRETCLSCLQAHCRSIVEQIDANSSDYLPGGCHWDLYHKTNPTDEERLKLAHLDKLSLSNDPMEATFSYLDYDLSNNKSLGTASGMCAYWANRTHAWYEGLTPVQQQQACNLMRRLYVKTHKQAVGQYEAAKAAYHQHQEDKVEAAARARRNLIKLMLRHADTTIYRAVGPWHKYLDKMRAETEGNERNRSRIWLSQMSEQFSCLRYRCGVKFGCLPRKTCMGRKYSATHVNAQYEILLGKIERGEIKADEIRLEDKLLCIVDTFRDGVSLKSQVDFVAKTKTEYRREIDEIKEELRQEKLVTTTSRSRSGGRGRVVVTPQDKRVCQVCLHVESLFRECNVP